MGQKVFRRRRRHPRRRVEPTIPPSGREEEAVDIGAVVSGSRGSAVSTQRDPCPEPSWDGMAFSSPHQEEKRGAITPESHPALCNGPPWSSRSQLWRSTSSPSAPRFMYPSSEPCGVSSKGKGTSSVHPKHFTGFFNKNSTAASRRTAEGTVCCSKNRKPRSAKQSVANRGHSC